MSPEPSSDIEELNRRRADVALGWATVEAQNRRRRQRTYRRTSHQAGTAPARDERDGTCVIITAG